MKIFRVEPYKSSGPGGQRKNKRETAIRIVHIPTGITVHATEHRLQVQNKELAFKRIYEKLNKLAQKKKPRIKTKTPFRAKEKRLSEKKMVSQKKNLRRQVNSEE